MPKRMFVDPEAERKEQSISFQDIPVNCYKKTVAEEYEAGVYSKDDLLNIYHDMFVIRTFENMLHSIKTMGEYNGHSFSYTGPAHLSIGEEAYAVGEAFLLDKDDFIFGGHRGHHETIAKALSVIRKLEHSELEKLMREYHDGAQYELIKEHLDTPDAELFAQRFFLYGIMAEIFAKYNGFGHGLGGSMHVFFTPFGIYPNNAIVGGSGGIAAGAALYKKLQKKPGICVVNSGDGSLSTGAAWEAINFATMDQYTKLWEEAYQGGLPILFNYVNNYYAMSGQTYGETMGYQILGPCGRCLQ